MPVCAAKSRVKLRDSNVLITDTHPTIDRKGAGAPEHGINFIQSSSSRGCGARVVQDPVPRLGCRLCRLCLAAGWRAPRLRWSAPKRKPRRAKRGCNETRPQMPPTTGASLRFGALAPKAILTTPLGRSRVGCDSRSFLTLRCFLHRPGRLHLAPGGGVTRRSHEIERAALSRPA